MDLVDYCYIRDMLLLRQHALIMQSEDINIKSLKWNPLDPETFAFVCSNKDEDMSCIFFWNKQRGCLNH